MSFITMFACLSMISCGYESIKVNLYGDGNGVDNVELVNCRTKNSTVPALEVSIPVDTIPQFMNKSPQDGIIEALDYYGIEYSDIVYAQAILETGWFKSRICLQYNNLFGLYNSRTKSFYRFNHWSESVIAYKKWIQSRYRSPGDYYQFLVQINYAEDKEYVSKLKKIVSKIENDKRRYTEGGIIPQRL